MDKELNYYEYDEVLDELREVFEEDLKLTMAEEKDETQTAEEPKEEEKPAETSDEETSDTE